LILDCLDLQRLQVLTDGFLQSMIASTNKLPYAIRFIAHETFTALQVGVMIR